MQPQACHHNSQHFQFLKQRRGWKKAPDPLRIQDLRYESLGIESSFPASYFTCVIQELRESTLSRFTISLHRLHPKQLQSKRKVLLQRVSLIRQRKLFYSTGISFSMSLFVQLSYQHFFFSLSPEDRVKRDRTHVHTFHCLEERQHRD